MQRYLVVTISRLTGVFRTLFLAAVIWFACPHPGHAMEYFIDTKADMDTIRFVFDQKNLSAKVRRTGRKQVTVSFPQNALKNEKPPTPLSLSSLRIVNSIKVAPSSITIDTGLSGFGFIRIPAGNEEMVLQFFRDPIGSKWRSPAERSREEKARKEAARKKNAAKRIPKKKPAVPEKKVADSKPAKAPESGGKIPVISEVDLPPDEESPVLKDELAAADRVEKTVQQAPVPGAEEEFYPEPYTYRAPVAMVGPGEAEPVNTLDESPVTRPRMSGLASEPIAVSPAGSEKASGAVAPPSVAPKATDEERVAVNLSEQGGSAGGQIAPPVSDNQEEEVYSEEGFDEGEDFPDLEIDAEALDEEAGQDISNVERASELSAVPETDQGSGSVSGRVVSPDMMVGSTAKSEVVQPVVRDGSAGQVVPSRRQGGAGGSVAPSPTERESVSQPSAGESGEGAVAGRVAPPPAQTGGRVSAPVEGQASGSVASPGGSVSGAIGTPPTEKASSADQSPSEDELSEEAIDYGELNGTDEFYPEEEAGETDPALAEGDGAGGELPDGEQPVSPEDRVAVAKGVLLAAEDALSEGEIEAAVNGFKEVSLMPTIPKEMRLRALYGKAEALTEFHRDAVKENFGDIFSAWMEAMNADTKSPNVPMALLNLGLINLKVGNMPEAKAYFNLLKSQYPNDPNIPYISYYWGEYYLGMEDYEKAADQFQYLVQMYPDSKVVRDAALGLAKSLDQLGYNEQAYQIIDYIDKRWPRFYIEDLEFLLMTANNQNRLGKINDAKSNYWAYYNLAPDAKEADIVLARIGDIYLKQGDKKAAKEVYEKAAKQFPDEEGGLVAMMRLAEEGIHDDPSMSEMDKVFDRPYNLRPQKIYTRIVEKHPDSPLAPLALLKLGMWYYWNKNYGECLGAVQDFLDKYPRSGLREKASQLGTRVFDMAVPELVKDENYGRVINYWNKYARKNNEGKDVNDDTRMGVALSFWKKEQPRKALELIDRYLQKDQVPKYSNMALDMALGIYVDDQSWSNVTELASMAKDNWKIDPRQEVHLEYAQAMAFENLGETERSTPLWAGLASNLLLPASSRAYAMYYMSKAAMKKKELKKVFVYAQEALAMLLETGGDREKIKDCILMTIFASESSGRYREALKWAAEYDKYIPLSDPEWASSRFRLAQLYEKAGALSEWKKLMEEVAEKSPDDLYGRLATSALETHKIEQEASKFNPDPVFQ